MFLLNIHEVIDGRFAKRAFLLAENKDYPVWNCTRFFGSAIVYIVHELRADQL